MSIFKSSRPGSRRSCDDIRRDVAATRARMHEAIGDLKSHAPQREALRDSREISRDMSGAMGRRIKGLAKRHRAVSAVLAAGVLGLVAAKVRRSR